MFQQIPEILTKIIGLECCEAKIGYAGVLKLGFGEKVFYTHKLLEGVFHGEWDISSVTSAWRMVKDGKLICGACESEEESDLFLNILVGKKISNIIQPSPMDITFEFSNGITLLIFGQSRSNNILEVLAPGDISLEFCEGKWIESSSIEPREGLSDEELIQSNFSENCHRRWETLVPKKQKENQCRECVFYRPISGRFYFWDYGLCSNNESDFDGKVVAVSSGCPYFGTSLPSIEE